MKSARNSSPWVQKSSHCGSACICNLFQLASWIQFFVRFLYSLQQSSLFYLLCMFILQDCTLLKKFITDIFQKKFILFSVETSVYPSKTLNSGTFTVSRVRFSQKWMKFSNMNNFLCL